jgi:cell division septal protein FtsQ
MRLPNRQPVAGGRARRSAGSSPLALLSLVNRWRFAGVLLAAAAATWAAWLVTSHAFDLDPAKVQISSLVYTAPDAIQDAIDLAPSDTPNVFRIDTGRMERALDALPAVAEADVHVSLPDRLTVRVVERTPTFVVETSDNAYVIDVDGFVLDDLLEDEVAGLGIPVVRDLRDQFGPELEVGGRLDAISLAADLRLAAITPAMVGSQYTSLEVVADDGDGYYLIARPGGWRAIFGHYTPNLRPVEMIDQQVQCLRTLIAADEQDVSVVYLAPQDDRCGTFMPVTTPAPEPSAAPTPRRSR